MKHLFSYSVYQDLGDLSPDIPKLLSSVRCDGLELLTSHTDVDPAYRPYTTTVHLPYSTDWLAAWEGRAYEMSDEFARYYMYGKDRDQIVQTVRDMIGYAASLNPAHGVIHASNVSIPEIHLRRYTTDCRYVIEKFCEMVNAAVSTFPGGEPPFKLVFENLWWPGLRLQSDADYRLLEKKIEFENWGICLDTGHLMNTLPVRTELEGIEALLKVFDGYSSDLIDSISAMHFHYSASADYRGSFEEIEYEGGPVTDFLKGAYHHITTLDQHLPFTDRRCRELVEFIRPEYLIHELPGHGHDPMVDFAQQRNLLD
jgi:hypothetical protein